LPVKVVVDHGVLVLSIVADADADAAVVVLAA